MKTVAFFDLDYTLLKASSSIAYTKAAIKQRRLPLWVAGQVAGLLATKRLGFVEAHQQLMSYIGRAGQADTARFCEAVVKQSLLPHLSIQGLARVKWHEQEGHQVVLLSASLEELVRPVANHLNIDYRATYFAKQHDRYTGELVGPACYEAGKIYWANHWCAEQGSQLADMVSYFYSDSSADLPLLELVQHPIAVNPSRKLKNIAAARGWQRVKW